MIIGGTMFLRTTTVAWSYIGGVALAGSNPVMDITSLSPIAGDLIILASSPGASAPSGYTAAFSQVGLAVCYKIAGASESNPTYSNGSDTAAAALAVVFRGISSSPIDVVGIGARNTSSPSAIATNSVTTAQNNDLCLHFGDYQRDITGTPSLGLFGAATACVGITSPSALSWALRVDRVNQDMAGSSTGRTSNFGASVVEAGAVQIAFKQALP